MIIKNYSLERNRNRNDNQLERNTCMLVQQERSSPKHNTAKARIYELMVIFAEDVDTQIAE